MRILLIGHSHSVAVYSAITELGGDDATRVTAYDFDYVHLKLDPFHGLLRDSQSQFTDGARVLSERLAAAQAIVLCLEGNWHNALGMLERHPRLDFFGEAGEAPVDEGRQIIPRNALVQVLAHRMESPMKSTEGVLRASFLDVLTFVRERADGPVALVEPPPPIPDAAKIARFRSAAIIDERGVTPYGIRHKLWRLQCSLLRGYCDRHQADYLPVPKEVFAADGVVDPRAYDGVEDPTHMGLWYGRFVLKEINGWLERRGLALPAG